MRGGLIAHELQAKIERVNQRAAEARHQHTYRYLEPSRLLAGWNVLRCTKCPRTVTRRREAS